MIAAIYARKSTEQTGVADEQRSVARQVEHARQYAERKGWTVAGGHTGSRYFAGEQHDSHKLADVTAANGRRLLFASLVTRS
jgi:hypothetical protein